MFSVCNSKNTFHQGDSLHVWDDLTNDLVEHILAHPRIKGKHEFAELGRWVWQRYPCVKREGKKPWVSLFLSYAEFCEQNGYVLSAYDKCCFCKKATVFWCASCARYICVDCWSSHKVRQPFYTDTEKFFMI